MGMRKPKGRACSGVLTKHVRQQLMRRSNKKPVQPDMSDKQDHQ
jgi:hypothetical protein